MPELFRWLASPACALPSAAVMPCGDGFRQGQTPARPRLSAITAARRPLLPPSSPETEMDWKTDRAPSTPRLEDDPLVRGRGRYAADAPMEGEAQACFVR